MYILLTKTNTVSEIIPDIDPAFPSIPIEARYTPAFVAKLLHIDDATEVAQNWVYDPDTGALSAPPDPEEDPAETQP